MLGCWVWIAHDGFVEQNGERSSLRKVHVKMPEKAPIVHTVKVTARSLKQSFDMLGTVSSCRARLDVSKPIFSESIATTYNIYIYE